MGTASIDDLGVSLGEPALLRRSREPTDRDLARLLCQYCREFTNLFTAFFAEKDIHEDWYQRLFIYGDEHYSTGGHRLMFRELAKYLL